MTTLEEIPGRGLITPRRRGKVDGVVAFGFEAVTLDPTTGIKGVGDDAASVRVAAVSLLSAVSSQTLSNVLGCSRTLERTQLER